jgi:hypothetical protein
MLNSYIYGGFSRVSSRQQSFLEFREAELQNQKAVNNEGDLLDYETLELRVHPPNIRVNIEETETTITLDSANRPGTLIEVQLGRPIVPLGVRLRPVSCSIRGMMARAGSSMPD